MRKDFEYVPTVPVELAQKLATYKATKVLFTGAIIGVTTIGYWPIALTLIPVSFIANKIVKKVLGL
ncbi:hypothetical protein P7D40_09015 [Enterococcus dongliensis]|uniref:hypothetical protein n=1 Tax=Enterococcus dongliensis TaxID=2559925 RepID=UPI00288F8D70|nr:hypothetical protein [Enterococcus dongliensis]MDT2635029.1 hypothetical protein [Enterococcus dongliensis]